MDTSTNYISKSNKVIASSEAKNQQALSLSKNEFRLLTGLLTGHWFVRYDLYKIGKENFDICRLCGSATKNTAYILRHWSNLDASRDKSNVYMEKINFAKGVIFWGYFCPPLYNEVIAKATSKSSLLGS